MTEKPAPLAHADDDDDIDQNDPMTTEIVEGSDAVDAAPTRSRVAPASQEEMTVTDARQAPLAVGEDDADLEPIHQMTRRIKHMEIEKQTVKTTTKIYQQNNNNTQIPPKPQTTTYTPSKYVYNMKHERRGKAIIINNINFHRATGMSKRSGSDKDARGLEEIFQKLGFEVMAYTDLTVRKTRALLQLVSQHDHTNADCLLFAIMSHGDDGNLYCIDGTIPVAEITRPFRGDTCASLAGKPKLFFIQACRGQQLDDGAAIRVGLEETDAALSDDEIQIIPAEADFLVGYSSPPGYYSWRNKGIGAWFIQAILSVLNDHGTELEIQQLMTRVNHIVAYEYTSDCSIPGYDQKKQIPCIVSTLTKELYFGSLPGSTKV